MFLLFFRIYLNWAFGALKRYFKWFNIYPLTALKHESHYQANSNFPTIFLTFAQFSRAKPFHQLKDDLEGFPTSSMVNGIVSTNKNILYICI